MSTPGMGDWLIDGSRAVAQVVKTEHGLALQNGLVRREFREGTTVALDNLMTGESMLRAVKPEATFAVGGKTVWIGGLEGQPDLAYLTPKWLDAMKPADNSLRFVDYRSERTPGKNGVDLHLRYAGLGYRAEVNYRLYDGMPLMEKSFDLVNESGVSATLEGFTSEILGLVEADSNVDSSVEWRRPMINVVTDYSFAGMSINSSNRTVRWEIEPEYTTQVNYERKTPCRLEVRCPLGPNVDLAHGETFHSFKAFELLQDSTDRERNGLAIRKMYRKVAPWVLDNPLMLHLTSTDPQVVHRAIDQAAECGFEIVIISFWSGLDMEDDSPANIAKFKGFVEYAHSKGLRLGGYSLLASRSVGPETDVINKETGKPGGAIFGSSPCLCSEWGTEYFRKIKHFIEATGFDLLEHDGSYPGDPCASTTHPGHKGYEDSQWKQYQVIASFYRWCREHNVFLNVPDNYFLAGSNKTGMGYRESNWSLPREQQHIHARQNLFDGTWEKTPSMGWMMVPLVEYQGGGAAATIEPLHEHLQDYGLHLANNLGWGAQACYRGPRLYDTPETKAMVIKWVSWFKKHRAILESDVIHVRRADGRNLDVALHVNPMLPTQAMAVIYNPVDEPLEQEISLPLYYANLRGSVKVSHEDGPTKTLKLDDQHRLTMKVKVPGRSCTWFTVGR